MANSASRETEGHNEGNNEGRLGVLPRSGDFQLVCPTDE